MKIDPNKLCFWVVVLIVYAMVQTGCGQSEYAKARTKAVAACRLVVQSDTGCQNIHVSQLVRSSWSDHTIQFEACGKLLTYQYGQKREGTALTCWRISK